LTWSVPLWNGSRKHDTGSKAGQILDESGGPQSRQMFRHFKTHGEIKRLIDIDPKTEIERAKFVRRNYRHERST